MSDDTENDLIQTARTGAPENLDEPVGLGPGTLDLSEIDVDPGPARSRPPPKPKPRIPTPRPPAPSHSDHISSVPPTRPSAPPLPAPPLDPHDEVQDRPSIKPMRMIKLGEDRVRTEPPPSALERLPSSRPPPGREGFDGRSARAFREPPTEPSALVDPEEEVELSAETLVDLEPPTPRRLEEPEPTTPRAPESLPETDVASEDDGPPVRGTSLRPPLPRRSSRPAPPSTRLAMDSGPDIEVRRSPLPAVQTPLPPPVPAQPARHTSSEAEELPDTEVAPASEDEPPISVQDPVAEASAEDDSLSVSVEVTTEDAPNEHDYLAELAGLSPEGSAPPLPPSVGSPPAPAAASHDAPPESSGRRPPPPPKRGKGAPPAPSERAVAQALEAPTFEPPTTKPRAKPWWEDLFTDDFGRGILPISEKQVKREVDFIEDSLNVAKGGVVMDLACGSGHHATELAGRGYGVVGFDLSLPQLALAGEYAQERGRKINFLQGDMREMSFDEVFDGIYCWNTSFGYFEEERNFAVAQRVFKALRPGGSFLLDVINRDFVVEHQPSQVWFEGDSCVCMDDMSVDFITSRLRVKRTMMLDDGRTRECTFSIRIYALHELGKLLHDIGFRVTEASGHHAYPGVFFGATSPRVIIVAQKP